MASKHIVRISLIAALYILLTIALAPISFGVFQFRVSEMLKPLALFNPYLSIGFGIGTFFSNLVSPFGAWDFICMSIVDVVAAYLCWKLRERPLLSLVLQAFIISVGVSVFPLWLGGGIPPQATFFPVFVSQLILLLGSWYIVWKPQKQVLDKAFQN